MTHKPPSHNEIHIGGNASGPVVAGDNIRVKVTQPAETTRTDQTNTAKDDGTVYAAANGDIHIHHDEAGDEEED
ncbi:hypothetical protein SAMN04487981_110313 [Streptomyces sp. cf386]|uniref:hypothetical protein n=1 Tax=Streptomyces sp. cf386 TaxID=1761904 RepID=UPI00089069B3|nr:hypothetical protein [Streptomyces sp. cf386]SDO42166.1 hypothetical protein SAMN04487981_110313 [Streptomyces sp. cf386]